jgi:hypothetical protein
MCGQNELADLYGFWHHRGCLDTMPGPLVVTGTGSGANERDELTVYSHTPYKHTDGRTYIIQRRASSLWVGVPNTDFDRPQVGTHSMVLWDMKDAGETCLAASLSTTAMTNYGTTTNELWSGSVRTFRKGSYLQVDDPGTDCAALTRTIEVWFRCTGSEDRIHTILSTCVSGATACGYNIRLTADGYLQAEINQSKGASQYRAAVASGASAVDLRDSAWHHAAVTWDPADDLKLYLGSATGAMTLQTVTRTGTVAAWNTDVGGQVLYVGRSADSTDNYGWFVGDIAGVSVLYSHVQSASALAASHVIEAPRYAAASATAYNWYPLHAGSLLSNTASYIRERSKACGETFRQIGEGLVCASNEPSEQDFMLSWRGTLITKGTLSSTGTNEYDLGATNYGWQTSTTDGSPNQSGPLPGDTLYLKDHSLGTAGEWLMAGHVLKWTGRTEVFSFDDIVDTTGKGAGGTNTVDYCIVRLHRTGTQEGSTCTAVDAGSGSGLTGIYQYVWRYVNTLTGYYGAFSTESTQVSVTSNDMTVSGWAAQPTDQGVTRLEIYRRLVSAAGVEGPYCLVKSVDTLHYEDPLGATGTHYWHRNDLATTYTDNGWANGDALTDTCTEYYERPGAYSNVQVHDQRLVAVDKNQLRLSSMNLYEYMSSADARAVTVTAALLQGAVVQVGYSEQEEITAYCSEIGYGTSGVPGANLLIFTKDRASRFYGTSRADFSYVPAFDVGCINQGSLANGDGQLFWNDGNRIVTLAPGSNMPVEISGTMWPDGIRKHITATDKEACMRAWSAIYWHGWYLLAYSESGYQPDATWCYHIASGTWTRYPYGFMDFAQWDRAGNPGGRILTGSVPDGAAATGNISALWEDTASYNFMALSRIMTPPGLMKSGHVDRITSAWKSPVGTNVTVAITAYADGDTVNAPGDTVSKTLDNVAATSGKRVLVSSGELGTNSWLLQAKFSGTSTVATRLEAIKAEFAGHTERN